MGGLTYIYEGDLQASLRPVATLRTTVTDLKRSGVRFKRVRTNLGDAHAALMEVDGVQLAILQEDESPRLGEVEILASETVEPGQALATLLDALGMSSDVVAWRLDPADGPLGRQRSRD